MVHRAFLWRCLYLGEYGRVLCLGFCFLKQNGNMLEKSWFDTGFNPWASLPVPFCHSRKSLLLCSKHLINLSMLVLLSDWSMLMKIGLLKGIAAVLKTRRDIKGTGGVQQSLRLEKATPDREDWGSLNVFSGHCSFQGQLCRVPRCTINNKDGFC